MMSDLVDPAAAPRTQKRAQPRSTDSSRSGGHQRRETSSPQMISGVAEARLLEALIVVGGVRHVLEIGTLTGVGTWRWRRAAIRRADHHTRA